MSREIEIHVPVHHGVKTSGLRQVPPPKTMDMSSWDRPAVPTVSDVVQYFDANSRAWVLQEVAEGRRDDIAWWLAKSFDLTRSGARRLAYDIATRVKRDGASALDGAP